VNYLELVQQALHNAPQATRQPPEPGKRCERSETRELSPPPSSLSSLSSLNSHPCPAPISEDAETCRIIEQNLGLPPGSLELWEERAAIMEYDAKQPRQLAEELARADVARQLGLF
jgi:hypothetical protein